MCSKYISDYCRPWYEISNLKDCTIFLNWLSKEKLLQEKMFFTCSAFKSCILTEQVHCTVFVAQAGRAFGAHSTFLCACTPLFPLKGRRWWCVPIPWPHVHMGATPVGYTMALTHSRDGIDPRNTPNQLDLFLVWLTSSPGEFSGVLDLFVFHLNES